VTTAENQRRGISRWLPIVTWLPRYDRAFLRGDVAAGIAVTALIVPRTWGMRASPACRCKNGAVRGGGGGAILYALFGTSQQISTGQAHPLPPLPAERCC
jgi:MFS superfamily sulfate permease-like transporter